MNVKPWVPFNQPALGPDEVGEVARTLESGWLTTGPRVARFERDFGDYIGVPHSLAVCSATAALHLALLASDVGTGDEVITSPLTFCSTVQTILQIGARPVLADVGPDLNIDPMSIEQRRTTRTRAIVPVHLGGLPCDMEAIWGIARAGGSIAVIEDAAHAVGSRYRGRPVGAAAPDGSGSQATCFSFYATKNLTTGEGGMVVTGDGQIDRTMRILSNHGIDRNAFNRGKGKWYYEVIMNGFKYNMSDVHAAIGIHQLRKQESFILARARLAARYDAAFADLAEIETPPDTTGGRHSWHLYPIRIRLEALRIGRDRFIDELLHRGVETSVHFIPIPAHPFYRRLDLDPCPRAFAEYARLVSLPLYPTLTDSQLDHVVSAVLDVVDRHRQG